MAQLFWEDRTTDLDKVRLKNHLAMDDKEGGFTKLIIGAEHLGVCVLGPRA